MRIATGGCAAFAFVVASAVAADAQPTTKVVTYAEVEPILLSRCVMCHIESNGRMGPPPAGYVVRTYEQTLGATERARVVPRNPAASELVRRIKGLSQPRMPFQMAALSDEEIATVERWIADGARDREGKPAPMPVGARVRFVGKLTGPREIDGLPFKADGVRSEGAMDVGARAELRGTVEPDGSIRAARIRTR